MQSFLKTYPQAKWHVYEPVNRDNVLEGAKLAFGQPVETQYKLENADVILSLDADFLYAGFPASRVMRAILPSAAIPMRGDEPTVCRGEHAEFDGREGGPSAADAGA